MAGRVDEIQTAVNTSVLDVTVTHSCQLFPEVGTVLVLDIFDNRIPAAGAKAYGKFAFTKAME